MNKEAITQKAVSLTGIKPTGEIHIGNYFGAIVPALELAKTHQARYFIADYHALNTIKEPKMLRSYTLGVATCWLACGLDPNAVLFYRQSDVHQTFELATMLMAFTAKGLMNRAHAYKDVVAKNIAAQKESDFGVNMGLFTYPVLMAADILLFDADLVPVGKDQFQHIEIAADIAGAFNHNYGVEAFKIPAPLVNRDSQIVVGLDGRKMSKSYSNTIALFQDEKSLRKQIMRIVTNSQGVEEVKDPDVCNLFALYKLVATPEQQQQLANRYRAGGMGWGEAKEALFNCLNSKIAPMRDIYNDYMSNPQKIQDILEMGAQKARLLAKQKLEKLRHIIGID